MLVPTTYFKAIAAIIILGLVIPFQTFTIFSNDANNKKSVLALTPPSLQIDATITPEQIHPGDYARVTIRVTGNSASVPAENAPTSVVVVLDNSASMEIGDLYEQTRTAAIGLINNMAPTHKIGLVIFADEATVKSPLVTNHEEVVNTIQNLDDPDDGTNLLAAFTLANNLLRQDDAYNKMVILFTDGEPTPDKSVQEAQILSELESLLNEQIHYFTVGFKGVSQLLLILMAEKTGGKYFDVTTSAEVSKAFSDSYNTMKNTLYVRGVRILEKMADGFEVKPDSLAYSVVGGTYSSNFEGDMLAAAQAFYNSGVLITPKVSLLGPQHIFEVTFEITTMNCKSTSQSLEIENPDETYVEYNIGGPSLPPVRHPELSLLVDPCGVYLYKYSTTEYSITGERRMVYVELRNTFHDIDVKRIHYEEKVGEGVHIAVATMQPLIPPSQMPVHMITHWVGGPWYPAWAIDWPYLEVKANDTLVFSYEVFIYDGHVDDAGSPVTYQPPLSINPSLDWWSWSNCTGIMNLGDSEATASCFTKPSHIHYEYLDLNSRPVTEDCYFYDLLWPATSERTEAGIECDWIIIK